MSKKKTRHDKLKEDMDRRARENAGSKGQKRRKWAHLHELSEFMDWLGLPHN